MCGNACAAGQVCTAGVCVLTCAAGQTDCAGQCRDTQTDRAHCGMCGNACAAGQVCSAGACQVSCGSGTTNCSGVCRDLSTDRLNCGTCGRGCAAGEVCEGGVCTATCGGGQVFCAGACRDVQTDRAHCGACGNACAAGQLCVAGACVLSCAAGQTACAGTCRDLQTDRNNCGACGTACASGQVCTAGACVLSCPTGLTGCGSTCRDLQTDRNHCGACGRVCATGQVCVSGACALSCAAGQTACSGACVDTNYDPAHCGMCGRACAAGQLCDRGVCLSVSLPFPARFFPITVSGTQGGYVDLDFDALGNLLVPTHDGRVISVSRIDGTQRVIASGLPGRGLGIVWHAAQARIYVISDNGGIYAVNPTNGASALLANIQSSVTNALAVVPQGFGSFGGFLAVVGQFNEIRMVNPATGAVTNFAMPGNASDILFTPSGDAIVVGSATVKRVTSGGVVTTIHTGSGVSYDGVAFDARRNLFYLADASGDRLFSLPATGGTATALGSYDFDSGFFVAGLAFDGVDTLIMATGESSLTLVARNPLP
jgi:hypothetical protein